MDKERLIEEIVGRAKKNFSKGFNCAEAVFEAVLNSMELGLDNDALRLATGFGGGIGLFGDTCGAIAGAVLAVSAGFGRTGLPETAPEEQLKAAVKELYGKPGLYRIFNQIPNQIEKVYGNTLCREITKAYQKEWLCRDHALMCRGVIMDAARIAAEILLSEKEVVASKPFGKNVENLID